MLKLRIKPYIVNTQGPQGTVGTDGSPGQRGIDVSSWLTFK